MASGCTHRRIPPAPMLRDRTWALLARPDETLCYKCFLDRCTERNVAIELEDLKPCPVNLFHQPHSWFDHYARDASPEAVQAWLDEYDRALDTYDPDQFKLPFDRKCTDFNRSLIRLRSYDPAQLSLPFDKDCCDYNRALANFHGS